MISSPAFDEIEGVTVFRDDEDRTRFYYLPRRPTLQRGEDGKPMFTFLRYQFPVNRGGAEPGGGYMVFTTAMREDANFLQTKVKPQLQQRLRAENPTDPTLPPVTLA